MATNIDPELVEVLHADRGILEAFGMSVASAKGGVCVIHCTVPPSLVNAGGFAHGSIAFSVMDTACAYAIRSQGRRGVTSNGNITYVKGGQAGSKLRGEVRVVSMTRRVASLRGEVYLFDDNPPDSQPPGELAAHGTFVFQLAVD